MQIQFFGAARQVTGSKHLLTTDAGTTILLDCGLFQGLNTDELNQHFGFDPAEVQHVILSHAHIDHSGLLPRLVKEGFSGTIFCTAATADLCKIMLLDSARIQQRDLERVNRRRERQGRPTLPILYDEDDAEQALTQMKAVPYGKSFRVSDDVTAILTDAGHLLGSASVHLTIAEQNTIKTLFFSGDIGRPNDQILRSPERFLPADYILCESTYGDKRHPADPDLKGRLLRIVEETCLEKRGKLLIPAFAVDRTQELIYTLDQLSSEGQLPRLPVYIDSPMSVSATEAMREHDEDFNPDILAYIKKDGDAFDFPNLHYISDVEESKELNFLDGPAIIIAPSGMAEAGRIKHHLKNNLEDDRNTVLFVGYASPNSLGGVLKRGDKEVKIFGEHYVVNARVESLDGFSAHADYVEMLEFLACQDPADVKAVFLVHGEYDTQQIWAEKLKAAGFQDVRIPDMAERVVL